MGFLEFVGGGCGQPTGKLVTGTGETCNYREAAVDTGGGRNPIDQSRTFLFDPPPMPTGFSRIPSKRIAKLWRIPDAPLVIIHQSNVPVE